MRPVSAGSRAPRSACSGKLAWLWRLPPRTKRVMELTGVYKVPLSNWRPERKPGVASAPANPEFDPYPSSPTLIGDLISNPSLPSRIAMTGLTNVFHKSLTVIAVNAVDDDLASWGLASDGREVLRCVENDPVEGAGLTAGCLTPTISRHPRLRSVIHARPSSGAPHTWISDQARKPRRACATHCQQLPRCLPEPRRECPESC